MKGKRMKRFSSAAAALLGFLLVSAQSSEDFLAQRREFREQIKNKIEYELDKEGLYSAVIFESEKDSYDFEMAAGDRARLKKYMSSYFETDDDELLEKMADELNKGRYVIYKDYQDDGVDLKVVFLSPRAKYWEWLTDGNGIEKMFHVYNFSVGLYEAGRDEYVILQTEGTFFGISQQVTLPVLFTQDPETRTFAFHMPTQDEIIQAVEKMEPIEPGRTAPEQKFTDACRQHPFFRQKDEDGDYVVTDKEIKRYYKTTVTQLDSECPVKESTGHWTVQEDYPYLVVDYSLKTRVNIDAFIPKALRFLSGALEDIAQMISDEVSVKYLPLSMKNFRDKTQEWTRRGGPE